ncbi:DUF3099 domain-containing protein [Pimelobacter simplex]|nr:DUF3099 domain-containing protein [Pimelobacter simplex]
MSQARRRRVYFWMMGTCAVLIVLAWNVVRLFSTPLAVAMSVVAAVIPPVAVILANRGALGGDGDDGDGRDDDERR